MWSNYVLNKLRNNENNKDGDSDEYSCKILKEMYGESEKKIKEYKKVIFKDLIKSINPFVFSIMKSVYNNCRRNVISGDPGGIERGRDE